MRNALLLTMLSATLLLMGCPKRDAVKEAPPATSEEAAQRRPAWKQAPVGQGSATGAGAAGEQAGLAERIIYFDFDNADIRPEYQRHHCCSCATARAPAPSLKVRLEGHADERGSREYNIGLG